MAEANARTSAGDRAMDAVRDEMARAAQDGAIQMIGNILTELLRMRPEIAPQLAAEGKSLKGALEEMKKEAAKHRQGSWACLDGMTGARIALEYYGIHADGLEDAVRHALAPEARSCAAEHRPQTADALDIDALLGRL